MDNEFNFLMCGIAGYKINAPIEPSILKKMVSSLYHRGPDSDGYYRTEGYSAGMRRLSINDIKTGDQPLSNDDESVILFYNGEIYNSPELRQELEQKGYKFKTHSDGEVICHLYSELKEDLFERLDGMFAVALWIKRDQKLILARDIPGEKPLYYIKLSDSELIFASEIKSLLQCPGWDKSLDYQALWDFPTFLWIPEPRTAYRAVNALPRGHLLIADSEKIKIRPYDNKFNRNDIELDDKTIIEETRRVITKAVESRLLSDVPVGSFLSSGLDSSIVSSLAAKRLPELMTFTIGFEDVLDPYHGTADESIYAEKYAKALGVKHKTIHVRAEDFKNDLITFSTHADQPFSVSSGLGILSVTRAAHEAGIKVLLSGDGADECFGGYSWYTHLKQENSMPKYHSSTSKDISFQNFGIDLKERLSIINSYVPQKRAWAWHYYASEQEKINIYNRDFFETTQSSLRFFYNFKKDKEWTPEDFIKQDREFYFPNEMLRKVDRMTMAYSVEGRVPFAAPAVLSHAEKLQYHQMFRNKSLKWVLREAFRDILPKDIYKRPKHGFNVPVDYWLKNDWYHMIEESFAPDSALTKMGLIKKSSRNTAIAMLNDPQRLNGHTLFSFIMLNKWLERNYGNHC